MNISSPNLGTQDNIAMRKQKNPVSIKYNYNSLA